MTTATAINSASIDYFGERSESLGFPLSGLSTVDSDLQPFADAVLSRYGAIVNRLASIEGDVSVDGAWVDVLARLDLGDRIRFTRRGIPPDRLLEGFASGWEHRLTPNNWRTTIYTTTITRSI